MSRNRTERVQGVAMFAWACPGIGQDLRDKNACT